MAKLYALIENGQIIKYPYSVESLKIDNPQTSFPNNIGDDTLLAFSVTEVVLVASPEINDLTQRIIEEQPVFINGQWTQVWNVIPLSEEEIAQKKEEHNKLMERQRQSSFQQEADPLFFQWQRGEIEQQVYLEKVEEIRARFPYVV